MTDTTPIRQALVDARCRASLQWVTDLLTAGTIDRAQHDDLIRGLWDLDASALSSSTVDLIELVMGGEPTPEPEPEPPVGPPSIGFPTIDTTGARGDLKPTGTLYTTKHGQIVENLRIDGEIRVQHSDVIFRNCSTISQGGNGFSTTNNESVRFEDCSFDGQGRNAEPAGVRDNYTLLRCHFRRFGEGPRANSNVRIEACLIHEFANFVQQGAHADGIQCEGGSNIWIVGNTVLIEPDGANGAIFFSAQGDPNPGRNIWITDNLVGGGNYAINLDSAYKDVHILRNAFTTLIPDHEKGGHHGPIAYCPPEWEVSGNVWHDGPNAGKAVA